MGRPDRQTNELIKRWPCWLARLANRIVGWTDTYCSAGCGYPVTGSFHVMLDKIEEREVRALLCSLGGACEERVLRDPRDETGRHYADIRPDLARLVHDTPMEEGGHINLSFSEKA